MTSTPQAPPDLTPPLLLDPPWTRKLPERPVVSGVDPILWPASTTIPTNTQPNPLFPAPPDTNWAVLAARVARYERGADREEVAAAHAMFFAQAPTDMIGEVLPRWLPTRPESADRALAIATVLAQRLGANAEAGLAKLADHGVHEILAVLETFDSALMARLFAHLHYRRNAASPRADAWLLAHPDAAAYGLIPTSVGRDSSRRPPAEDALRFIAKAHRSVVERVADAYGAEVRHAIDQILATDGTERVPNRMPKLPEFIEPTALTPPLLADHRHRISIDAACNLALMLAISPVHVPYPGLMMVLPELDPDSTADFAWQICEAWQAAGHPNKQSWAHTMLGVVGNDDVIRKLVPLIRAWPSQGGSKRANDGLSVLANIGSDYAVAQLSALSQKLRSRRAKQDALVRLQRVARERGLGADELADRLVPDLGLDASGSLVLDFGTREFVVGFDEHLKPVVRDEDGKLRKSLPKPGKNDASEPAAAAKARFTLLKKDARAVASDQLVRLERALTQPRRWSAEDFDQYFVQHPFLIHLVRRLIWGVYHDSTLAASFRVCEDRTLSTSVDEDFELANDAVVGLVHPLEVDSAELAAWAELLADYEILQPFDQVGRAIFEMSDDERSSPTLTRFNGMPHPFGKYLALEKLGWVRCRPEDGAVARGLFRPLADNTFVHLELEHGLYTAYLPDTPDQAIMSVWVNDSESPYRGAAHSHTFEGLEPRDISELVRDLTKTFS